MFKEPLGDRMRRYENVTRNYLVRRVPVIIRLDGKSFHTFTSGLKKPFDPILVSAMQNTMKLLCENIQGCVLGYTQSDEITLVVTDYATFDTMPWLNYSIRKMVSISASMTTLYFNRAFRSEARKYSLDFHTSNRVDDYAERDYIERVESITNSALFDSRAFNIPREEEVCNNLIWRQKDAIRNSIQMVGRAHFSHTELDRKSCDNIKSMLLEKHGIDWDNIPIHLQRGSCCIRVEIEKEYTPDVYQMLLEKRKEGEPEPLKTYKSSGWIIDTNIPLFTEDRDYVNKRLCVE